jgi:hypothetical protein
MFGPQGVIILLEALQGDSLKCSFKVIKIFFFGGGGGGGGGGFIYFYNWT